MRLNKYLITFTGLFTAVSLMLFVVLQKYFLLLLHHTIYYCKEMAETFAVRFPDGTGIIVFTILSIILVSTLIKLISTGLKIYRFRKGLQQDVTGNGRLSILLEKLDLQSKVKVVDSSRIFAVCFGILNPIIYLSTKLIKMLTKDELEVVLRHEKYHLKNRDTITLMLAVIFESFLPFVPIISDLIRQYKTDRELSADREAGLVYNGDKLLSTVLTKLLVCEPQYAFLPAPAITDAQTLEARICRLTSGAYHHKLFGIKNSLISVISVGFLLFLAFTPVNAVELHSDNHDVMIVCAATQSCDIACKKSEVIMEQTSSHLYTSKTHASYMSSN